MTNVVCGAKTKTNTLCNRLAVPAGKRCYIHGGLNTGPRTATGKARNGFTLKRYRITNGGVGKRKTDKARKRREAAVGREEATRARQERRARRLEYWRLKKKIALGLPLIPNPQD